MLKNRGVVILVLTLLYSILFYEQNAGLNFLLFNLILLGAYFLLHPVLLKNRDALALACTSVLSACMILIAPSNLAIVANVVSLLLFSATQDATGRSVLIRFLNACVSFAGSLVFVILTIADYVKQKNTTERKGQKLFLYLITCVVIIIFISIYKNINPLFEKYTKLLMLDFFTVKWLAFTFVGLLLIYGFVKHNRIPGLNEWELNTERPLEASGLQVFDITKKQAFTFLFIVLNILLIFITLLDINYLYLGAGLPDGITHKQFVHHGVGMLIFSILLGIAIILYAFHGSLNFDKNNRLLKFLVYGWIILNLFMVISTAMRNNLYIHEALLTYKRIGVYYWLMLAAAGLVATMIKIAKVKPEWYLVRTTSLAAYLLLLFSCPVDWDQMISTYNISRIKDIAALDKKYLIDLSEGNIKQLYGLKYHPKFEIDSVYHYRYSFYPSNKNDLDLKLFYFLREQQDKGWRSFSFRTNRVMQDIATLNQKELLDTLDLRYADNLRDLSCLEFIRTLKGLKLSFLDSKSDELIKDINGFKDLQMLQFRMTSINDTIILRRFKNIKTLRVGFASELDSILISKKKLPYNLVLFK